jgi:hypothetical protein
MKKEQIDYVCSECGLKASGGRSFTVSTYHFGKCDICKLKQVPVTQYRDFYYGQKERKNGKTS